MMDWIAYWIGYTVMVVAGIGVMLLAAWLVAEGVWRMWRGAMNAGDLMEAVREWRKNHPERQASLARRNGVAK